MITKDQIKAVLGLKTNREVASLFGCTESAVSQWGDGPIPALREYKLRHEILPEKFGSKAA